MAMTRQERVNLHKKQERVQVKEGVPNLGDLKEGVPVLRGDSQGVSEYVKYNNIMFKKQLDIA